MAINARFAHTNLIAKEWRTLASFYQEVFGCVPVPPERHYAGRELERGTGVSHARLDGVHLLLPGHGQHGPTLEIFDYTVLEERPKTAVNRPGFGHIAFAIDNVTTARERVLAAGGKSVGEIVTLQLETEARVTWCYVTDPEGNVIELQSWSP